jgi:hypothetical protein
MYVSAQSLDFLDLAEKCLISDLETARAQLFISDGHSLYYSRLHLTGFLFKNPYQKGGCAFCGPWCHLRAGQHTDIPAFSLRLGEVRRSELTCCFQLTIYATLWYGF